MKIIGHGGINRENTLSAFERAICLGVDMIEVDVQVTADGHLICFHDLEIDGRLIAETNLNDLPFRMLLVKQVIETSLDVSLYLDIKSHALFRLPLINALKSLLDKCRRSRLLLASFDHRLALDMKMMYPHIQVGLLVHSTLGSTVIASSADKEVRPDVLIVNHAFVTSDLVDQAHQYGLQIFSYTVNSKQEAKRLQMIGIDGIVSDHPDMLC